jgi:hypothetical protein
VDNFVIHLHLYLTSRETELTAFNNLKRLKNYGFKILVTSPKPIPLDFYQYIDHFYYNNENQMMELEYKKADPLVWWYAAGNIKFNFVVDGFQKHGLAVLRSMIKGCQIAKGLGYKNIIRFEFDDFFGKKSIGLIKEICSDIEDKKYDFYTYKNDYGGERVDISTHLIFYSCDSFLKLFGRIKNEYDYKEYLKDLEIPDEAIILEEFIYRYIQKHNLNVYYGNGHTMHQLFIDSAFNMHQSPIGVVDGAISDVMIIKRGEDRDLENLCIAAQNVSSDNPVIIYFDLYDKNKNLIKTDEIYLEIIGQWRYDFLNNTKNISEIKIRHQNNPVHKTFKVYFEDGQVNIINIDMPNVHNWQEIIFN